MKSALNILGYFGGPQASIFLNNFKDFLEAYNLSKISKIVFE